MVVVGSQAYQQRDQDRNGEERAGINSKRPERDANEQKNKGERRQQNGQWRDFVRRLLPLRALDQAQSSDPVPCPLSIVTWMTYECDRPERAFRPVTALQIPAALPDHRGQIHR